MQHPPRTTSPLASSSWQAYQQSDVDGSGDESDGSPFDEPRVLSPLSMARRESTRSDSDDEEDPFADDYHHPSRTARPTSTSAPASMSAHGLGRPVPRRHQGAYGRYVDASSRARRHHQTTPSVMTSSVNGLRKTQTPMQMLYDLPYTPSSTPSVSPNSSRQRRATSPPPIPARPRVIQPDAPLVVHRTRPSPFPLGPTPPLRASTMPAKSAHVPVHIVDVAVERFGLQLSTPSTAAPCSAPSSAPSSSASASASTDTEETEQLVTPTTPTTPTVSPVTSGMMMRRKPAVTALDMERERQWALWEAEHAPSATVAVTLPVEKKKFFSKSSSSSVKEDKPKKEKTKTKASRWWCCFGSSSAHETDDEEEWNVEHEKTPRPASRLRKRAN